MSKSDDEDKEENFFGNKNNNIMPLEEQEVFREMPSPNPNDKDKSTYSPLLLHKVSDKI